jgi:glutamyl-tRNA reductase
LNVWTREAELSRDRFQVFEGRDALDYLFRVVASLESMVVGVNQITGQFKKAYEEAQTQGFVRRRLHRVSQSALKVAKKIRQETEIGRLAVSVPSIGVKLAEGVLGDLSQLSVGVLGAGDMGRLAAEHFSTTAPKQLYIYNRSPSRALSLVDSLLREQVRASVVEDWPDLVQKSDVLVVAVDGLRIGREDLLSRLGDRESCFVLDLSAPPVVERFSDSRVLIYGIDELKRIAEENVEIRQRELERALDFVRGEVERVVADANQERLQETFQELSLKVEGLRKRELNALRTRLPSLSESEWKEIEGMSRRLADKIVQDPISELRRQGEEEETWLHFFRKLFKI